MAKPLDGIKVLSFEVQIAGPYCAMMLADQGAEVIKVEQPGSGDPARGLAPRVENEQGEQQSGYFLRFNRNKRSLTLNLKTEQGRHIFRELALKSDVLIENFRPGLLDELGLGYEELSEDHPGLVYASVTGFGMDGYLGPYSNAPRTTSSHRRWGG
jgi:crotonobetainyl-CoA:carnitine CoA-transferase CaiB-like acyl-CoA transferase